MEKRSGYGTEPTKTKWEQYSTFKMKIEFGEVEIVGFKQGGSGDRRKEGDEYER